MDTQQIEIEECNLEMEEEEEEEGEGEGEGEGEEDSEEENFQENNSQVPRSTSRPTKRKKPTKPTNDKADEVLDKVITFLESRKESRVADDEDDTYCKHLAFQLKGLPDRERKFVKFKVQEMIFNLQVSGMNFPQAMSTNSLPTPSLQQFGIHLPACVPLQAKNRFVSPESTPTQSPIASGFNFPEPMSSPSYQTNSFASPQPRFKNLFCYMFNCLAL